MSNLPIAIHLGAPETDNGQLVWSLRKDAGPLLENEGVLVRRPGTYQKKIRKVRSDLAAGTVTDEQRQALLADLIKDQEISRLVLSDPSHLGEPAWMLTGGRLFQNAGHKAHLLRSLFREFHCDFYLGIRNPATLVPAVFNAQTERPLEAFLGKTELLKLRWSEVIRDIRDQTPDSTLTVWSNEETPVLWPSILQSVTDLPESYRFEGELDIIEPILREDGMARMKTYLPAHPRMNESQRTQVRELFLENFYAETEVQEEIDLPGWSQTLVDEMTEVYLDDLDRIHEMDDVNVVSIRTVVGH